MIIMAWKVGISTLAKADGFVELVYFIMENAPLGWDKSMKLVDKIFGECWRAGLEKLMAVAVHVVMSTVHKDAAVIPRNSELCTNGKGIY